MARRRQVPAEQDRNVAIFAATGDIGRAFSLAAARERANVNISGRNEERVKALADSLR